jgi:hypothetical protein
LPDLRYRNFLKGLWISTLLILVLNVAQGWSGGWSAFFLDWPGANVSNSFLMFTAKLALYHEKMGFAMGALSILIIIFAFLARSNLYIRVFAILGFVTIVLAAWGGILYVESGLQDRLSLGQMSDAFIGAFAFYFLLLFLLNRTPRFPWDRNKSR